LAICWAAASFFLAACGEQSNVGAPPTPIQSGIKSPLRDGAVQSESLADDDWERVVRSAKFPLAVAYGFPDDEASFTVALFNSYEMKIADCMVANGLEYLPETGSESDENIRRNAVAQNELALEERARWNVQYDNCAATSARNTFVGNAFPSDSIPIGSDQSPEEAREAQLAWILDHRREIEELAKQVAS
jgi:hypothetical protein